MLTMMITVSRHGSICSLSDHGSPGTCVCVPPVQAKRRHQESRRAVQRCIQVQILCSCQVQIAYGAWKSNTLIRQAIISDVDHIQMTISRIVTIGSFSGTSAKEESPLQYYNARARHLAGPERTTSVSNGFLTIAIFCKCR